MKKIIFTTLVIGILALASSVLAVTSVSLSPSTVSVQQGQVFNVTVTLNPQGVKNYTAKLELKYPAKLLEAKSFTFGSNSSWIALNQPGYDLIDNVNGVLVKSGGYPGGVSSPVTFGTVSFLAKSSGNGAIELGNNSFVFDSANQNLLSGAQAKTTVTVSPKLVAQVATPKPTLKPSPTLSAVSQATTTSSPSVPLVEQTPLPTTGTPFLATIGTILSLGTNNAILGVLVVLALFYAVYAVFKRMRRKKN